MKIKLQEITIRALTEGYLNNAEDGVIGFGGKLDIRPKYQREFVYKDIQRNAVIETVRKDFPLNVMYWVKNGDSYEVLDGQQRTISLCSYVEGDFSIEDKDGSIQYFHNLTEDKKNQILDYKLMVYFCEGTDGEKLDWFRTINIAGEKLTEQELRNAVYTGAWLTDAKRYFSRSNCAAYNLASDYMNGTPIRQDYLQTVISWISEGNIEQYMADHQADPNASKLWLYFMSVINWVETTFPEYRREMRGLDWGALYNQYKDEALDAATLEAEVSRLMQDEDVSNKKGIYIYVLSRQERHLSIRAFTPNQKREAYERQGGVCAISGVKLDIAEMEADHITPWSQGGKTSAENCQMLSKEENRQKSDK